jgi:hypothetical protein
MGRVNETEQSTQLPCETASALAEDRILMLHMTLK